MKNYIHYGHTKFDKSVFNKIKNVDCSTKPKGGLWASDVESEHGWKNGAMKMNFEIAIKKIVLHLHCLTMQRFYILSL